MTKIINNRIAMIDKALGRYLPAADREPKRLSRAMRYSVFSGGKRIRPVITIEAAVACGAKVTDAMPTACAIELVHTYSLIHDDLPAMDDDDYRRGRLSCHRAFDEATAILAGDALLTLAFDVVTRHMKPAAAVSAVRELSKAIGARGMVGGQAIDMELQADKRRAGAIELINDMKTSRLFEVAARLGAISAGAGKSQVMAMAGYGLSLGRAFQMVDDILDRDGYFKACGEAKARSGACKAIGMAKRSIANVKNNGRLCEVADQVLERII